MGDSYFDDLCLACRRGDLPALELLMKKYNIREHYSQRDASGADANFKLPLHASYISRQGGRQSIIRVLQAARHAWRCC